MTVRIGTSGWAYNHWRNVLYETGLPTTRWLQRYTSEFDTVELNGSFYRWPRDEQFQRWRDQLPPGFLMAVKAARGLTHARRLRAPEEWIERLTRGWHALGDRAGPLLVQLHPALERDDARLEHFLGAMPADIPVAVEFRHRSWEDPAVYELLEKHDAAYVVMSGAGLPCILRATARFVYVRLHGPDPHDMYGGSYSADDLSWWAERIAEWDGQGRDVYTYFNNDLGGNAVRNARDLKTELSRRLEG
ncbi:DUF72 domain-containing protein [Mycolicibacterium vaccae]|jgi:uncharacterized protein YecE (DUF72 family)|uniref:Sensor histidine kinase n=1 Tax=Mycolicibacterium vaccae ATCC 25954 TaxID=1194972 RepID=K0V2E0_MYCVA|nr:DUF72 domain-containing protein [Mycolicibacterium vaccae]ANI37408.1 hypothetical protein MYVA_0124 [Mycolicibacterium vaccae 95051]EJZ11520.1 hypothetical protein MVAC_05737 [Mycolicibacterium vaccae ATCC 25954]MCV7061207.1 DUF72 domain-containing protein [Mycolicibacterium vaccae]